MDEQILELVEILESLLEDLPLKIKVELNDAIELLRNAEEVEDLIKAQEQLEVVSSISSLDSFVRNEIYNVISIIEELK